MVDTQFTFLNDPGSNDAEAPVTVVFEETFPPDNVGALPWTQIRFEESEGRDGPWVQIDSQSIPPLTVDSSDPIAQTLSTSAGTKIKGWYRVVWVNSGAASVIGDMKFNTILGTTATGIQKLIKSLMPTTWDRLARSPIYGTELLEEKIYNVKLVELPEAMANADESTYSPLLRNYIAKSAALDMIPTAIDYWMSQKITVSNTGTNETVSYSDRTVALRELGAYLLREVGRLKALIAQEIQTTAPIGTGPAVTQAGPLVTSDPWGWQPAFANDDYEANGPVIA